MVEDTDNPKNNNPETTESSNWKVWDEHLFSRLGWENYGQSPIRELVNCASEFAGIFCGAIFTSVFSLVTSPFLLCNNYPDLDNILNESYFIFGQTIKASLTIGVVLPLYGIYKISHKSCQILESDAKRAYKRIVSFSKSPRSEGGTTAETRPSTH